MSMAENSYENRYAPSIRAKRRCLERSIDISLLLTSLKLGWSARKKMDEALENAKTSNEKIISLLTLLCSVTDEAVEEFLMELRAGNQDHVANVIEGKDGRLPMTEEHYESFTGNREQLNNFIDPYDELYDILFDSKVFTHNDVDRVNCQQLDTLKSCEIVEIIMRKSDCCYRKFLSALERTRQSHVVFILTGNGEQPLSEDVLKHLHDNIRRLSRSLYVTADLLNELVQSGIFTSRGLERVRCLLTNKFECADMLMKLILRKSQSTFDKFYEALRRTSHEHTATLLVGADIEGEIHRESDRHLTDADNVAEQAEIVDTLNNYGELKELGHKNGFSCKFKTGSIRVVFSCYSLSAVDYVRQMILSKTFDGMLTEKCRMREEKYGWMSLTAAVPQVEFDKCSEVLCHNELMTAERFNSLQFFIENHIDLLRVDEELLRHLNLPEARLDDIRAATCSEERSKTLLTIISRQPNRIFIEFIDALKATDQADLAANIEQNARTRSHAALTESHCSTIPVNSTAAIGRKRRRRRRKTLIHFGKKQNPVTEKQPDRKTNDALSLTNACFPFTIDCFNGLLDELEKNGVIDPKRVQQLERMGSTRLCASQLLDDINKLPPDKKQSFLTALDKTHQSHVSNYIRNDGQQPATTDDENWPAVDGFIRLEQNWRLLVELVYSSNELCNELLSARCISSRDKERIDQYKVMASRNEELLNIMASKSRKDFKKFIECLIKTKQHHVAALLDPNIAQNSEPVEGKQVALLIRNYSTLVQLLELRGSGLLEKLLSADVITWYQKDFIESASTASESKERLLDCIKRGSKNDYDKFIECLDKTGHCHVADLLRSDGVVPEIVAETSLSSAEEAVIVKQFINYYRKTPTQQQQQLLDRVLDDLKDTHLIALTTAH